MRDDLPHDHRGTLEITASHFLLEFLRERHVLPGFVGGYGGPVTGASMNPARSFGPPLASGEWSEFWIYVIGPVAGAAVGAFAYQVVRDEAPA